jgi:hypothetical protein
VKICTLCGFLHETGRARIYDRCERCNAGLKELLPNLFKLENVSTRRRERINSDEEERFRQGFQIDTAVRFAEVDGALSFIRSTVLVDQEPLAHLAYGQRARLWRINKGWTRGEAKDGFWLDLQRGRWVGKPPDAEDDLGNVHAEEALATQTQKVMPFVEDHRNCLIFEPTQGLEEKAAATLQYALKTAIQAEYHLEESEIAATPLPSQDDRRVILFYESAEGGAGVLRDITESPDALSKVALKALEICLFNPDRARHDRSNEDCEAACYDCLLTYGNQREHHLLDRATIKDILLKLARSTVAAASTSEGRPDQLARLKKAADSGLEKEWLKAIERFKLRLPTHSQRLEESCGTRPDFTYDLQGTHAAVYVDGPPHDFPERQARDQQATRKLDDLGWIVIRFHHQADWERIFAEYPGVFGEIAR